MEVRRVDKVQVDRTGPVVIFKYIKKRKIIESGRVFHYFDFDFDLPKWVFSAPDSSHAVWIHKLRHPLLKLQMLVCKSHTLVSNIVPDNYKEI